MACGTTEGLEPSPCRQEAEVELWRVGVMALWVRQVCKMFLRESRLLAQFTIRCRVCRQVVLQPSHPTVMINKALNGAMLEHNGICP